MARAHVLAAERGARGETYLLGHRDASLAAIARMALSAAGQDNKPVVTAPFVAARVAARGMRLWADRVSRRAPLFTPEAVRIAELGLRADCSKSVRVLGVTYGPLERAVEDAVAWFAREGYLDERRRGLAAIFA